MRYGDMSMGGSTNRFRGTLYERYPRDQLDHLENADFDVLLGLISHEKSASRQTSFSVTQDLPLSSPEGFLINQSVINQLSAQLHEIFNTQDLFRMVQFVDILFYFLGDANTVKVLSNFIRFGTKFLLYDQGNYPDVLSNPEDAIEFVHEPAAESTTEFFHEFGSEFFHEPAADSTTEFFFEPTGEFIQPDNTREFEMTPDKVSGIFEQDWGESWRNEHALPLPDLSPRETADMSEFYERLRTLPMQASRCDTFWEGEHIAYRCHTCATSSSSCICAWCFHSSDHRDHDYCIYRSELGGCCDCGDNSAWKESGFCHRHQPPSKIAEAFRVLGGRMRLMDSLRPRETALFNGLKKLIDIQSDPVSPQKFVRQITANFDSFDPSDLLHPQIKTKFLIVFIIVVHRLLAVLLKYVLLSSTPVRPHADSRAHLGPTLEGLTHYLVEWSACHQSIRRLVTYAAEIKPFGESEFLTNSIPTAEPYASLKRRAEDDESSNHMMEIEAEPPSDEKVSYFSEWLRFMSKLASFLDYQSREVQEILSKRGSSGSIWTLSFEGIESRYEDFLSGFAIPNQPVTPIFQTSSPPSESSGRLRRSVGEVWSGISSLALGSLRGRNGSGDLGFTTSFLESILYILPRLDIERNGSHRNGGGIHSAATNLLLELLFDRRFKIRFARRFVDQYSHLTQCSDPCLDRISVQLFSIPAVLCDLYYRKQLISSILGTQLETLQRCVVRGSYPPKLGLLPPLFDKKKILHSIGDLKTALLDSGVILQRMFAEPTVIANEFLRNGILPILRKCQAATSYQRRIIDHVEYEDTVQWSNSFIINIEYLNALEILFAHIRNNQTKCTPYGSLLVRTCGHALLDWLAQAISVSTDHTNIPQHKLVRTLGFRQIPNPVSTVECTFQLPLHRFFFSIICQYTRLGDSPGKYLYELCSSDRENTSGKIFIEEDKINDDVSRDERKKFFSLNQFLSLFEYFFRSTSLLHEISTANLWTRNGLAPWSEASLYKRHHWCPFYYEADLNAIQLGFWAAVEIEKIWEDNRSIRIRDIGNLREETILSESVRSSTDLWMLGYPGSNMIIIAMIATLCERFEVGQTMKIIRSESAGLSQLNRDSMLFSLVHMLGYLLNLSGSGVLASSTIIREHHFYNLERYNLENVILHRFLLPSLSTMQIPAISEILDICTSVKAKKLALEILFQWGGKEMSLDNHQQNELLQKELGRQSINDPPINSPETPQCTSGKAISTEDDDAIQRLKMNGWLRYEPFYPFCGWDDFQAMEEGFSKFVEASPMNFARWFDAQSELPILGNINLSSIENSLIQNRTPAYFALTRHPCIKGFFILSLFRTLACAFGEQHLASVLSTMFDPHRVTERLDVTVSERLVNSIFQFVVKLLAVERQYEKYHGDAAVVTISSVFTFDLDQIGIVELTKMITDLGDVSIDSILGMRLKITESSGSKVVMPQGNILDLFYWIRNTKPSDHFSSAYKWIDLIFLTCKAGRILTENTNELIHFDQDRSEVNKKFRPTTHSIR